MHRQTQITFMDFFIVVMYLITVGQYCDIYLSQNRTSECCVRVKCVTNSLGHELCGQLFLHYKN